LGVWPVNPLDFQKGVRKASIPVPPFAPCQLDFRSFGRGRLSQNQPKCLSWESQRGLMQTARLFSTPTLFGTWHFYFPSYTIATANFLIKCSSSRNPSSFDYFSHPHELLLFVGLTPQYRTWIIICKHPVPVPIPPTIVATRCTTEDRVKQAKHSQSLICQPSTRTCFP